MFFKFVLVDCVPNYYELGYDVPFSSVSLNAGKGHIGKEYVIHFGIAVRCLKD